MLQFARRSSTQEFSPWDTLSRVLAKVVVNPFSEIMRLFVKPINIDLIELRAKPSARKVLDLLKNNTSSTENLVLIFLAVDLQWVPREDLSFYTL
jgi:hypothetical protein